MLLRRLGIVEENQRDVRLGEVNPIGGITPLRTRIRDLEAESMAKAKNLGKEMKDAS